jgi:hypothetical protein
MSNIEIMLTELFHENHVIKKGVNPNSAFFVGCSTHQINLLKTSVCEVLHSLGRKFIIINATYKTNLQFYNEFTNGHFTTINEAWLAAKDKMYQEDVAFIIISFSQSKITNKSLRIRSLIKALDDAHYKGVHPKSDLVFIDSLSMLSTAYKDIGSYVISNIYLH